ncbi:helix-turn-helix domain-containing protein [Limosilactobacillus mucosae]
MNRLREVRKERGLTLKQLSKMLDEQGLLSVKANTLSRYENGKHEPSIQALKAYAEFFDVTIDYLLGAVWTQCAKETDDESDFEFLEEMYDLEYCPYCGRKL